MTRKGSFEERIRAEAERINAEEAERERDDLRRQLEAPQEPEERPDSEAARSWWQRWFGG